MEVKFSVAMFGHKRVPCETLHGICTKAFGLVVLLVKGEAIAREILTQIKKLIRK